MLLCVWSATMSADVRERLWQSFITPPDSIRVGCYYYWVNERVDPKGVVADLQWMKDNGITLAFLATDIRNRTSWENPWAGETFGKNKFQSRLWWKNLRTALKTAGRLGIEMGIFNCPGWSQSGGPWVRPEEAMRNWTPQGIEICKTKQGTDVVCSPCSPEAEGLEVDKLSKTYVQKHFESFFGEILRRIPPKDRPTLTTVVVDSWERGKQNYTDSIFDKFQQRFGYPLDYTNPSCQKDLDRLIADLVASEYMGGLTEKAHEYGLRTWCEPYAHSPFPGNSITYGSAADEVAAEFWVNDRKFRKKEVDAALGAARRSGKNRVWAESFTDGWPELAKDDWSFEKLKPIADRYFHAGINATILHVMVSQPGDDRQPAVRPWFGTYFDRRSQHAADLKPLVQYLRRCNFMLQLGRPYNNATDERILDDGTIIRFTESSCFEVTFTDGHRELWNPVNGQCVLQNAKAVGRKMLFNDDWVFCLKDSNFAQARRVDLPHDWSILQRFDRKAPAGNDGGYLPTGRGWYRKQFTVGEDRVGKRLRLYFEGVYMNACVYVNGHLAGGWPYGYTSFWVDMTPYVRKGLNEVVVSVDNAQQKNCRWYTGSGIYRNVWLVTTPMTYIDEWSVSVTTPDMHTVQITADVVDADGQRMPLQRTVHVDQPRLWSPDHPNLYQTELVTADGSDRLTVSYGLRTVSYDAERGLLLNGEPLKLNGACLHHDNGVLGAAAFDAAEQRKARLMKEAGFNAVRTSHNPPSDAFLQACDELGLLVIDEAFDGWRDEKNRHDYHELIDQWWQRDLEALVRRDRNHPSVFCWSIGNEIIERKKPEAVQMARQMAACVRQFDPQRRPVTSALASWDSDWDIYDPLAAEHDIVGYNYMMHKAEGDHERVPERVMMQTESYPRDAWTNYERTMSHPYIIGDFVWTGLDYLGESGIGRWYYQGDVEGEHYQRPLYPWHAAYCGDVDLTGRRKPISFYRSLLWNASATRPLYLAVREPDGYRGTIATTLWGTWPTFENWNWPGWEGRDITVEVYSRQSPVRLYLNDRLVGEKSVSQMMAVFTLPYQPGILRAEAGGEKVELATAGTPAALRLTADRQRLTADGQDLSFVTVEVVDADGRLVPTADSRLTFKVEGAATLQAAGNADIKDEDPYCDNTHRAWKGCALCVIRSAKKSGPVRLTVSSPSLPDASVEMEAVEVSASSADVSAVGMPTMSHSFNLVFIGNSITYGALHPHRETTAPPAQCSLWLQRQENIDSVYFQNCGRSGRTTYHFLPRADDVVPAGDKTYFADVVKKTRQLVDSHPSLPLVFSIMLGTNDTVERPRNAHTSTEDYVDNMVTIIDSLLSLWPDAHVVLNRPIYYTPDYHTKGGSIATKKSLRLLNDYYKSFPEIVARCKSGHVHQGDADAYGYFKEHWKTDVVEEKDARGKAYWLHPNEQGARQLGAFWGKAILKSVLSKLYDK